MSKINVIGKETSEILIFRAMCRKAKELGFEGDLRKTFGIPERSTTADVILTVNGVEIDIVSALASVMDTYDEHVKTAAKELLAGSKLDNLRAAIETAEYKIQEELDKILADSNA